MMDHEIISIPQLAFFAFLVLGSRVRGGFFLYQIYVSTITIFFGWGVAGVGYGGSPKIGVLVSGSLQPGKNGHQ